MPDPDPKISRNYVGPDPDHGSHCSCGQPAAAKCEGCGANFCRFHWWKHSHGKGAQAK